MSLEAQAGGLREAAVRGVKWTSASAVVGMLAGVVQPVVLVRLLEPEHFGLMATVLVVVGFTQAFADMGLSSAIQVRPDLSRPALSTLFWANLAVGLALFGVAWAGAPALADFYGGDERLVELTRWAALAFPLGALSNVPKSLLQRELRFRAVARAEVAGALASLVVSIAAAAAGANALALVWGWLAGVALRSTLVTLPVLPTWRPTWRLRRGDLRGYLGFGLLQMGERTVNFVTGYVDYILIGRFLGPEALGVYAISYQLVIRPLTQLNPVITRVATPVFAKRHDDDVALRRGFLESTRLIALLAMPALAGLALVAGAFVPVVLGAGWDSAATLIPILAGVGLMQTLTNPIGSVFLAKQRPDIGFKLNVVALPVLTLLLLAVVERGTEAVAWAYLGFSVATAVLVTPWLMARVIGLSARRYAASLATPVLLTAAMALPVAAALAAVRALSGSDVLALLVPAAVGALAYGALLVRYEGSYLRELWRLARRRAPGPAVGGLAGAPGAG